MTDAPTDQARSGSFRSFGLGAGPLAALVLLAVPAPDGLTAPAWATAAVAIWMAIWWASEALPLAATALLPLVLFPVLDVLDIKTAAAPFANPLIFLFLGGFLIALAMQRWNLHRRIALAIISQAGSHPARLIGGIMFATAFLSMWISNTATAMMMMPIAASLAIILLPDSDGPARPERSSDFATVLMLATAYSASIGGLATLVGSPPNALLAAFMLQTYGIEIGFAQWMAIGLPLTFVLLPTAWFMLTRISFRLPASENVAHGQVIDDELDALGPLSVAEKRVAMIFSLVAFLWLTRPFLSAFSGIDGLSDAGIAIGGALLLFVVPAHWPDRVFLLDWEWAKRAPWDILLLFGGGLSLAQAVDKTGLAIWIGSGLSVIGLWPVLLLVAAVVALIIFLTELTSNTATTAAFLPVVGAVAVQAELAPLLLALPAAFAASCAFMLPVATPPNAIVFGSGYVGIPQMMRAGLWLNLIGVVAITTVTALLARLVFG